MNSIRWFGVIYLWYELTLVVNEKFEQIPTQHLSNVVLIPQETILKSARWKPKPGLLEYMHIPGSHCPESMCGLADARLPTQSQLPSESQRCSIFFACSQASTCLSKMLSTTEGMMQGGCWWWEEGVKTEAACKATLFSFFWRTKLLILLTWHVPSFLLRLSVVEELNY